MSFFVSKILSKWLLSSKNLLYLRFALGFSFCICFFFLFYIFFICFSLAFGVINLRLSLPHLAKTHVYTKNCLYHLSYVIYLFPPLPSLSILCILFPDTFQSIIFSCCSVYAVKVITHQCMCFKWMCECSLSIFFFFCFPSWLKS